MSARGFSSIRVQGVGPKDAKLYIVGESPGREEEKSGIPFVGPAGRELDSMLGAAGIERRASYIDNICQYRPTGTEKDLCFFAGKNRPSPQFMEGIANIAKLVQEYKPNVVVAVGAYALWGLTFKQGISNWAGSILQAPYGDPPPKVIPILHPASLLRGQYQLRQPTIWHLRRAREESLTPELSLPKYDFTIVQSQADLASARDEILAAERFVFDIEISGRSLLCIGFGLSPTRAICVPSDIPTAMEFYKEVIESPVPKGNQNVMFDWTFLEVFFGIRPENITFDTMLAAHAVYPTLPHDLAFLTSVYTRQPFYKAEGKVWRTKADRQMLYNYNCKDCAVTYEINNKLDAELDEYDVRECAEFMVSLIPPYAHATVKGMRVSRPRLREMAEAVSQAVTALQAVLDAKLGRSINVRSPVEVKKVVYEELKLPKRTREGKLTSRQEVLLDLAAKTGSPELRTIVKLRKLKKLLSNYLTESLLDDDGRLRCNHNIGGTKTGRLSTTQTLWGGGSNLQNWPDKALLITKEKRLEAGNTRKIVTPDEGFTFVALDLQQAESVVVAFDSEDPLEIEWFEQGLDSHRMLAAMIFNKDPADISGEERYIAKRCHHAFNYVLGHVKFSMIVNEDYEETGIAITPDASKAIKNRFHAIRPNLQVWWQEIIDLIRKPPHIIQNLAPSRRKRTFIELWSDESIRDFISWKPQSTVGDVCHEGIRRWWYDSDFECVRKEGSMFLLNQLHDGVMYEVRDELVDELLEPLAKLALVELEAKGRKFTIPVEVKVSKSSWGELEKIAVFKGG